MSLPVKPWEVGGNSLNGSISSFQSQPDRLHSSAIPYPGSGGGSSADASASASSIPPLPPRPGQTRPLYSSGSVYNRSSMMPYSGGYGSPYYGSSSYSPYGMGGLGSYGMGGSYGYGGGGYYGNRMGMYGGMGNNPMNPDGTPSFTQLAEESSANAFQSIESFVSAFGSISAMLESTFHAVYSSFRAVVGVADHMGRLKHILSAMAVFRFFRWTIRRFLYLVGISKIKPEDVESLWSTLSGGGGLEEERNEWESELHPNSKGSSWPILMFLGFILAGPYLMWKLISSLNLNPNTKGHKGWATGQSDHFLAVAQYDFEGMADRELKLSSGQKIRLAPAASQPPNVKGWVLASDGVKIGLVPTNYIKILGKRTGNNAENNDLGPPPLNNIHRQRPNPLPHPVQAQSGQSSFVPPTVPLPTVVPTPSPAAHNPISRMQPKLSSIPEVSKEKEKMSNPDIVLTPPESNESESESPKHPPT